MPAALCAPPHVESLNQPLHAAFHLQLPSVTAEQVAPVMRRGTRGDLPVH